MVKLVVMYGPPTDAAAFEEYYASTHLPLAAKIENVRQFEASRVVGTPSGEAPPYYRMAEVWFDSHEVLQAALATPEGQATTEDIANFATGGVTIVVSEVD